ncbi:hypothetical protein Tco_1011657, partial [Tanacetum coccineum]
MTSRRPSILNRSSTQTQIELPTQEDQIRDYRQMARNRHQVARTTRRVFGRNNYNRTLETAVDPERQLEISRERRANLVPAEVLYSNNRSTARHRVYEHYSEQRILCVGENQINLRLCNEESYENLRNSGLQHIHLGIFMIRLHALHRRSAGTNALVVLRDTRWEDSRQIIATMEVDLSAGTQLVYTFPDMILSVNDFHNHVEVAIQTHGYDTWQGGESNLLITMALTGRLSNTSYMGFQYSVENVVDHLTTTGITTIPGERRSIEELEGMSWHLKPPEQTSVHVPSRVVVNERLNRSVSLRFERYRQTPQPPRYSVDQHDREILGNDHLDEDEEHFIGICLQDPQTQHIPCDICFCEDCLNEARTLEEEPLNKAKRSNKPKRSKQRSWEKWSTLGEPSGKWDYYVRKITILDEKDNWDDDERNGGKILVLQEQFSQNQQDFLDEYLPQWDDQLAIQKHKSEMEWENPFAAKRGENHTVLHLSKNEEKDDDLPYPKFRKFKQLAAQIINKHEEHAFPTVVDDAESSTSYQPPPSLSKKIEESFKAKHPGFSARVLLAIKFTHTFVSEISKQGNIARSTVYQELDHDDNWDIVLADFDDSSVYSISEGEGDVYQNISIMVQDTPLEEAAFMAIEGTNESDDEQSIEEDYYSHHAFMFHPGPPTKIADMVQSAGSWKPDKELPTQSKSCEHDWKENTVTNYTVCYYCGILTTDMSRLNCPKCQLTTCALCARNYLGKTVNVKGKQPHKPEEEKDFHSNEVRLLKELLKEKTEQVQQMIKDQAKEYYENRAIMQRKEELWQSEKSLLIKDLTDALKIIDQLKTEQIKFKEQKDEEIRKLKAQLQEEKDKETEV